MQHKFLDLSCIYYETNLCQAKCMDFPANKFVKFQAPLITNKIDDLLNININIRYI